MGSFDLVSSLQTLPETDPVEVDGIQFGVHNTCQMACVVTSCTPIFTVCAPFTCM